MERQTKEDHDQMMERLLQMFVEALAADGTGRTPSTTIRSLPHRRPHMLTPTPAPFTLSPTPESAQQARLPNVKLSRFSETDKEDMLSWIHMVELVFVPHGISERLKLPMWYPSSVAMQKASTTRFILRPDNFQRGQSSRMHLCNGMRTLWRGRKCCSVRCDIFSTSDIRLTAIRTNTVCTTWQKLQLVGQLFETPVVGQQYVKRAGPLVQFVQMNFPEEVSEIIPLEVQNLMVHQYLSIWLQG
jgi:hypothetical protein